MGMFVSTAPAPAGDASQSAPSRKAAEVTDQDHARGDAVVVAANAAAARATGEGSTSTVVPTLASASRIQISAMRRGAMRGP